MAVIERRPEFRRPFGRYVGKATAAVFLILSLLCLSFSLRTAFVMSNACVLINSPHQKHAKGREPDYRS
jgi:hypothetical protein